MLKRSSHARTFICIQPPIGGKDVYRAVPFALQVHSRGKIRGFFEAIEGRGDIFRPGNVDENLETLRDRYCLWVGVETEHFGLYAKARGGRDVDDHV